MINLIDLLFRSGNSVDKVFQTGTSSLTIPAGGTAIRTIPHEAGEIPLYTVQWSRNGTTWFPAGHTDSVTDGAYSPTTVLAYTNENNLYVWASITGSSRTIQIKYELYYLEDE